MDQSEEGGRLSCTREESGARAVDSGPERTKGMHGGTSRAPEGSWGRRAVAKYTAPLTQMVIWPHRLPRVHSQVVRGGMRRGGYRRIEVEVEEYVHWPKSHTRCRSRFRISPLAHSSSSLEESGNFIIAPRELDA